MFTINIKKLRKQRYYIHHKSNKTNNGNEKHSKKIKVKILHIFLWNKFVQKLLQTVKRLLNISTVARY